MTPQESIHPHQEVKNAVDEALRSHRISRLKLSIIAKQLSYVSLFGGSLVRGVEQYQDRNLAEKQDELFVALGKQFPKESPRFSGTSFEFARAMIYYQMSRYAEALELREEQIAKRLKMVFEQESIGDVHSWDIQAVALLLSMGVLTVEAAVNRLIVIYKVFSRLWRPSPKLVQTIQERLFEASEFNHSVGREHLTDSPYALDKLRKMAEAYCFREELRANKDELQVTLNPSVVSDDRDSENDDSVFTSEEPAQMFRPEARLNSEAPGGAENQNSTTSNVRSVNDLLRLLPLKLAGRYTNWLLSVGPLSLMPEFKGVNVRALVSAMILKEAADTGITTYPGGFAPPVFGFDSLKERKVIEAKNLTDAAALQTLAEHVSREPLLVGVLEFSTPSSRRLAQIALRGNANSNYWVVTFGQKLFIVHKLSKITAVGENLIPDLMASEAPNEAAAVKTLALDYFGRDKTQKVTSSDLPFLMTAAYYLLTSQEVLPAGFTRSENVFRAASRAALLDLIHASTRREKSETLKLKAA